MEFIRKYLDNYLIFEARDIALDNPGVLRYKRELAHALFQEENIQNIVLQFKDVIFKDNNSVGALLYARRYTKGREGQCVILSPNAKALSLLKMAKMDNLFTILSDENGISTFMEELEGREAASGRARNAEDEDNKNEDDNSSEKYPVDGDFKFIE